ncbi:MAG: DUF1826 domain-containing protein, partial [Bacteroidota bacterium]
MGVSSQKSSTPQAPSPTVPSCAPIILRGTAWPNTPKSGLLHR